MTRLERERLYEATYLGKLVTFRESVLRVASIAVEEAIRTHEEVTEPIVIVQLEGYGGLRRYEIDESDLDTELILTHGNPTGGDGTDVFAHL